MSSFVHDMTVRWACRAGDYVLWANFIGLFSSLGKQYKPADAWALRDGNFVTITNRPSDFPDGFDLHPSEVSGQLVGWMMQRLSAGYEPEEPIDAPNLWRVRAGDRVAWVGAPRGGVDADGPVLGLLNFDVDALVYGEPLDILLGFGGVEEKDESEEKVRLLREAWKAICNLGTPNTAAGDDRWGLG